MNFSGHGIIDLPSYDAYMSGKLQDYALPGEEIERLVRDLDKFPKPSAK
jgi:tryptophan synthase beta chain